jgi:sialate O-acetylesterase
MKFSLQAFVMSFAAVCLVASARADVRLHGLFADHLVLQREVPAPVWGWAEPGEEVTVQFSGQTVCATAKLDGRWEVRLAPMKVNGTPQELIVTGKNAITLRDVLVGDVWLGSGQSNMEWPTREITDAAAEIAAANFPSIRLFTVPRLMKAQRVYDVEGRWAVCQPDAVRDFSALLYLFGREIHAQTGVPLGLLHSSVGGTRIELWTAPEGFGSVAEFADHVRSIREVDERYRASLPPKFAELEAWLEKTKSALANGKPVPITPDWPDHPHPRDGAAILYDGMIHPLVPFGLRGVIWYQGEWNGGENEIYVKRMEALINGWRAVWGNPELPFYYVQLARMPQKDCPPWQGDGLAPTREAQRRSLAIPHTGMATIIDLEGNSDWHPRNKQDVAKRLSLWALKHDYGRSNLVVSGPLFKSMTAERDGIRIRFDSVGSGLLLASKNGLEPVKPTPGESLRNFAIAGADRKWVNARAVIAGADVLVSSVAVPHPVAVRYAYCQDPVGCNLYNQEGLPASPFRTDNW